MGRVSGVLDAMGFHLGQDQKRQILLLDKEISQLELKLKALEAENLKLRAEVNPLKKEVERLKQQAQQKPRAVSAVHAIEQDATDLMLFIGERRSVTAEDIRGGTEMHSVQVEHLLGELVAAGYLDSNHVPMVGAMYSLSHRGNAHLVKNKLVPLRSPQTDKPDNPKGHHCDKCGGIRLKRIGSRPDPTFGALGIKEALYSCLDCTWQSSFSNDE